MGVTALGLPKGPLHGMDEDGVPLDMSTFGPVYIKYNSNWANSDAASGTAILSGYEGDFRGVYVSPWFKDGQTVKQKVYGVLPGDLFTSESIQFAAVESSGINIKGPTEVFRADDAGTNTRRGGSQGQQRVLDTTFGKAEMAVIVKQLP